MQVKINNRICNLIAELERISGKLEVKLNKIERRRIDELSLILDENLANELESYLNDKELSIFDKLSADSYPKLSQILDLRREDRAELILDGEVVFQVLAPYQVVRKYLEIKSWLEDEIKSGDLHPLLVSAVFCLLFLQCSPLKSDNLIFAHILSKKLLLDSGYPALSTSNLLDKPDDYIKALRRAEMTAGTDWSTLNAWVEFFLEGLLLGVKDLEKELLRVSETLHLTSLQKEIIEVISKNGALNREAISEKLGINPSTVKYNLSVLHSKGHLERRGGGRSTTYSVL